MSTTQQPCSATMRVNVPLRDRDGNYVPPGRVEKTIEFTYPAPGVEPAAVAVHREMVAVTLDGEPWYAAGAALLMALTGKDESAVFRAIESVLKVIDVCPDVPVADLLAYALKTDLVRSETVYASTTLDEVPTWLGWAMTYDRDPGIRDRWLCRIEHSLDPRLVRMRDAMTTGLDAALLDPEREQP